MDPAPRSELDEATDRLYAGSRACVRALHDAMLELTHALGDDVRPRPAPDRIEVLRGSVFLDLSPGPSDSLRIGLYYTGDVPSDERLLPNEGPTGDEAAGSGPGQPASHCVQLDWDAMDQDVIALEPLIEAAYDQHA